MRFANMVDDVWKKALSVDFTEVAKAIATSAVKSAVKQRSRSIIPWLIGGAAIGFGAGVILGPKLMQRGKSITAAAGEALTRIGSEVSEAMQTEESAEGEEASNGQRHPKKRSTPTAKA